RARIRTCAWPGRSITSDKRHYSPRSPMSKGMGWARALIRTCACTLLGLALLATLLEKPCVAMNFAATNGQSASTERQRRRQRRHSAKPQGARTAKQATPAATPQVGPASQTAPAAGLQPTREAEPRSTTGATVSGMEGATGTGLSSGAVGATGARANPYDEIVVTAVGDVMLGTTFPDDSSLPPNDGADLLTEVTPFLKRGDVVFGNLKGPIVDGGTSLKCKGKAEGRCFAFRVPTRYNKYLKEAGFTVMGLANNHAMDFGLEGRASSRQALKAVQIAHTGEVGDIARLMVKGRKVNVIAFATYPGAYNFLDIDESLQTRRAAREEAEMVIVGFHDETESATHQHVLEGDETFLGEDRGDLRRFTHAAIDAGADLVLGSGPHVVRAMEVYKGKLIAYSLGNFAT